MPDVLESTSSKCSPQDILEPLLEALCCAACMQDQRDLPLDHQYRCAFWLSPSFPLKR